MMFVNYEINTWEKLLNDLEKNNICENKIEKNFY